MSKCSCVRTQVSGMQAFVGLKLPELHESHDSIPRGAGSPEVSPVSSSLSMGTIPRDDQSALVSSDSDPKRPLNPTVTPTRMMIVV